MLSLNGKRILVAGGTGEVGEGVVRAMLQRGAIAIVSSRSEDRLDALRDRLGDLATDRLVTHVVNVGTEEGAAALRDWIAARVGSLDGVVASLGGWWQGQSLTRVSLELWNRLLDMGLTAHFILAKTFIPVLAERSGSSYTLINGAGGLSAVQKAGPISVSAAAQLMLKDVLAEENPIVRINSLVLATPVRTRSRPDGPDSWLTADDAGTYAAYLASDQAIDVRGETIVFRDRSQLPDDA